MSIRSHHDELDPSVIEMLITFPAIVAASVYKYWTSTWEKATKKVFMGELLQLVEMTSSRGLMLNKEVYIALDGFDGNLGKEKAKSLRFKVDALVAIEAHLKAKLEVAIENLRQA
ncbi:hypothetical protein Adt_03147 [Abeliophyllum distichum]|uniref:Uncharacterized protein n=1 Tax=Abeliophyllum distichum TaxID=126358 RepID=A0ABD1VXQ0_9LAMI